LALVLPRTKLGVTEASTRRPSTPSTFNSQSTTGPTAQVLLG
jgi:hypothetical protein